MNNDDEKIIKRTINRERDNERKKGNWRKGKEIKRRKNRRKEGVEENRKERLAKIR